MEHLYGFQHMLWVASTEMESKQSHKWKIFSRQLLGWHWSKTFFALTSKAAPHPCIGGQRRRIRMWAFSALQDSSVPGRSCGCINILPKTQHSSCRHGEYLRGNRFCCRQLSQRHESEWLRCGSQIQFHGLSFQDLKPFLQGKFSGRTASCSVPWNEVGGRSVLSPGQTELGEIAAPWLVQSRKAAQTFPSLRARLLTSPAHKRSTAP